MNNLKLAVFATQKGSVPPSIIHLAHALLLQEPMSNNLMCEIHVGKMITRFNPNPDYFLEDLLWQLNDYCQIPAGEIESDVHYPEPISIEEEFSADECKRSRESVHTQLIASGINFHVVNWSALEVEEKISLLKNQGAKINSSSFEVH